MESGVNPPSTTMASSSSLTNPPSASNEPPPYPPYSLEHVASYTDKQILHYIRMNQISDRQASCGQSRKEMNSFARLGLLPTASARRLYLLRQNGPWRTMESLI